MSHSTLLQQPRGGLRITMSMETVQRPLRRCLAVAVAVVCASAYRKEGGDAVWMGVQGFSSAVSPSCPPTSTTAWVRMSTNLETTKISSHKQCFLKAKPGDDDVFAELENKISGKNDNKSMSFLRKIGKVGGAANKNFVNAVGADEGVVGKVAPAEGNGMAVSTLLERELHAVIASCPAGR
jgi:hypothetical protein